MLITLEKNLSIYEYNIHGEVLHRSKEYEYLVSQNQIT